MSLHSPRHTLGRFMRTQNVPSEQIQAQLGHKMPGVTETYAEYDPNYQREATAGIELFMERVLEAERLIKEHSGTGQLPASDVEVQLEEARPYIESNGKFGEPDRMKQ